MNKAKLSYAVVFGTLIFATSFYAGQNWDRFFVKSNSWTCQSESNTINVNDCINKQENTMTYMIESAKAFFFTAQIISPQPLEVEGTTINQPPVREIVGKGGLDCSMSVNKDYFCVHPSYWGMVYHNAGMRRIEEAQKRMGIIK